MAHRKFRGKLNNKAFSLVELIVVVMIMGILTAGVSVTVSVIYNANVENAAERLVMQIDKARTETLTSQDESVYLKVFLDTDNNYYASVCRGTGLSSDEVISSQKLGSDSFSVNFIPTAEGTEASINIRGPYSDTVGAGTSLILSFDKATGGIKPYTGTTDTFVSDVVIAGNDLADVIIIHETGRVYIEYYEG